MYVCLLCSPLCTLWILLLLFLDDDLEWLDVSGVASPGSRVPVMRSSVADAGRFTATEGWDAADAEPNKIRETG